ELRGRTDVRVAVVPPMHGFVDFAHSRATLVPESLRAPSGPAMPGGAPGVPGGYARLAQGRVGVAQTKQLLYDGETVFAVLQTSGLVSHRNWVALDVGGSRRESGDLPAVGFPTIGPAL